MDRLGKPLGTDFLSFWAASKLALAGHGPFVYAPATHAAAQSAAFGGLDLGYAAFFYPPVYLLICLPLALAPYMVSLCAWLGVTGLGYWQVARAWLDERAGTLAIFAFPAVFLNIGHGQNAFLTCALFGGGLLALARRPALAGVCFGLLVFKPHLGLLIPVALVASSQWRTIVSAACTVAGLGALSLAVLGRETWSGFFQLSSLARAALENGLVEPAKMQSVFAGLRLMGAPVDLAYAAQILVGLAAATTVFAVARRRPIGQPLGAALICGTLVASPFLLDYDLVLAALPMAWLVSAGLRHGFLPWEKTTLAMTYVLPLISRLVAMTLGIPLAPLTLTALLIVVVRRAWTTTSSQIDVAAAGEDLERPGEDRTPRHSAWADVCPAL